MPAKGKDAKRQNVFFEETMNYPKYEYQQLENGSGIVRGCTVKGSRKRKKIRALGKLRKVS